MRLPPALRRLAEIQPEAAARILADSWSRFVRLGDPCFLADAPLRRRAAKVAGVPRVLHGQARVLIEVQAGTLRLEALLSGLTHTCESHIIRAADEAATQALTSATRKEARRHGQKRWN